LFGYYLKVDSKNLKITADLYDSCCSHYLVTNGNLTLNVKKNEKIEKIFLKEGDAVWISSFVYHGFSGTGSLAKISDGQNFNYLEKVDLMNLYNPKKPYKELEKIKLIGVMMNDLEVYSIWIIGPSASGKTSVSLDLYSKIKKKPTVIIDGDVMRKIYGNSFGYDKISRSKNTLRYAALVSWLQKFGISSIVSVISPFQEDRDECRKIIKNYFEVYLNCSLETRIKRDKKDIYKSALEGRRKDVVDVDIPFEQPLNCDLVLNSENNKSQILSQELFNQISKKYSI
jgi:adenylylsulfate kinase-like enzyme